MAEKPRLLICGTGAMAGLFGVRLAPYADITLLGSWPEGLAAIQQHGLQLEGPEPQTVRLRASSDPHDCLGVRQALVLVKAWQTERAARQLAICLAPDGLALSLQNGLGNLEQLQAVLGAGRTALGVTTLGATLLGPGRVRPGGEGPITLTRQAGLESLVDVLMRAGFSVDRVDDLQGLLWGKLAINAGINPLTALLEVPNGALLERPDARALLIATAQEVASVAARQGIQLSTSEPAIFVQEVARRTAANLSSMFQDIRRGAPTEIDAICGAVVRTAQELGMQAPLNETLWRLVRAKVHRFQGDAT